MTDEIKDQNIRDIRELARAVSDELSRENPKYIDSLRDHFALAVLPAVFAEYHAGIARRDYGCTPDWMDGVSSQAYQIADAMLATREQGT